MTMDGDKLPATKWPSKLAGNAKRSVWSQSQYCLFPSKFQLFQFGLHFLHRIRMPTRRQNATFGDETILCRSRNLIPFSGVKSSPGGQPIRNENGRINQNVKNVILIRQFQVRFSNSRAKYRREEKMRKQCASRWSGSQNGKKLFKPNFYPSFKQPTIQKWQCALFTAQRRQNRMNQCKTSNWMIWRPHPTVECPIKW